MAHLDVIPRMNAGLLQYTSKELSSDLRRFPWVRSVAGHFLYPWEDYGRASSKLVWFIFLRNPVQRFVSQYEYQVTRYGLSGDFWEWKRKYAQHNRQVVQLAGEPDLEAAKEVLTDKISAFGLVERFEESLLIIRESLELTDELNLACTEPRNVSRGNLKEMILDNYGTYEEAIEECNHLDMMLYDFAVTHLWPGQIEEYGGTRLLNRDRHLLFDSPEISHREVLNEKVSMLFRACVYRPLALIAS